MQIGEVASRTGLSLRTIRHYEEVGLVSPSGRTTGGFRIYAESDVQRLLLVKRMKPLGFSLEQMRELLAVRDALEAGATGARRAGLLEELNAFHVDAVERVAQVREHLGMAEAFASDLDAEVRRQRDSAVD